MEIRLIKSISLSGNDVEDNVYLGWSKTGLFSVKSTYLQVQAKKEENVAGGSSPGAFPWVKLWASGVPTKVKHCMYKIATNTIPCTENLAKRGMEVEH